MEKRRLGEKINAARKDRGITADTLAGLCGINATYLRQIESGAKVPSQPVFVDVLKTQKEKHTGMHRRISVPFFKIVGQTGVRQL